MFHLDIFYPVSFSGAIGQGFNKIMTTCKECKFFDNDPESLESTFPGFKILGSAYSSARGDAGICNFHNLFLLPGKACPEFEKKEAFSQTTEFL